MPIKKIAISAVAVIIAITICYAPGVAEDLSPWTGKVVGVSDGDTITVMRQGRGIRIRLAEIDCPEKGQPFGKKAKQFVSDLCFGKLVKVLPSTVDRYGRIVAHVVLADSSILSEELLASGLAWHYKKYSTSTKLPKIEAEAREAQLGLWSMPNPVPPWDWRNPPNSPPAAKQASQVGKYHGNVKSKIFHRPTCRYFNCKNCTAVFESREAAIEAGFRPCKICAP